MSSEELDGLIVENMADLEQSYRQFEALERLVFAQLGQAAEAWADENEWFGNFDYLEGELRLAPLSWRAEVDGQSTEPLAWFELVEGDGDPGGDSPDGDAFSLTRLCQSRSGTIGFRIWPVWSRWKIEGNKLPAWKRATRAKSGEFTAIGFSIGSEGTVFRQVKLDAEKLATGVRQGNIDDVLEPWRNVLGQLKLALPVVRTILAPVDT